MPRDRQKIGPPPEFTTCDPLSRVFPTSWKATWFRRHALAGENGVAVYTCPICNRPFDHSMIDFLHGDHVWPYSLFGETSWANYQLICGTCNVAKGNKLDKDVRSLLGAGEFRTTLIKYLESQITAGTLTKDSILTNLLGTPLQAPQC